MTMGIGTGRYWSPERHELAPYGAPSDVFAIGIMLFEMLSKQLPFEVSKEGSKGPRRQLPTWIDPQIKDFCLHLLEVDIYKRPTCEQALARLRTIG